MPGKNTETFSQAAIEAVSQKNPLLKRAIEEMLSKKLIKVDDKGGGNKC